jgi:hypothetical protein
VRSLPDRGSVLAADLLLAAVVVGMVASIAGAMASVELAVQEARIAARSAAVVAARSGDFETAAAWAGALAPGDAVVTVSRETEHILAIVQADVAVPHPISGRANVPTRGEANVPIAPYRSNRE